MPADRPSSAYPECVTRLIEEFGRLPGIGRRSAERLAFFVLKSPEPEAMRLAQAITDVKRRIRHCSTCWNLTDADPCPICYSVVHVGELSKPNQKCQTCRNGFHAACLRQWFESSGQGRCPMCRSFFR